MNAEYRGKMPLPQGIWLACWVHERNCHRSWNKGSALYSPQGVNGLNNYMKIYRICKSSRRDLKLDGIATFNITVYALGRLSHFVPKILHTR